MCPVTITTLRIDPLDRFIGHYEPYATSDDADAAVQEETGNVARAVARYATELRRGALEVTRPRGRRPRPK